MTPRASWWFRWNIAAGNLFFRFRNALFPIVFALALLGLRPRTQAIIKFLCLDALLPCCRELSEARQHLQRRGTA